MTRDRGASESRIGCIGLLGLALAGAVLIWVGTAIGGAIDRQLRTEIVDGFGAAGPIHLTADGRIALARAGTSAAAADGWVETFDPISRQRTTILEGLANPVAADIAPNGTACAIGRADQPGGPTPLRCSSGLAVDLAAADLTGLLAEPGFQSSLAADVVSDGATGWIIADAGRAAILHVDSDGVVAVMAVYERAGELASRPLGLAFDDGTVLVALQRGGYVRLEVTDREKRITDTTWVGGGDALAIAAWSNTPLVLVSDGDEDLVTHEVGVDTDRPRLVDGLRDASGLVLLPDHRIAVTEGSRLVIVRPSRTLPH